MRAWPSVYAIFLYAFYFATLSNKALPAVKEDFEALCVSVCNGKLIVVIPIIRCWSFTHSIEFVGNKGMYNAIMFSE